MRPILILGASGFIGYTIYKELTRYFKTYGTYNSSRDFIKNKLYIEYNHKKDSLEQILNELNPKLIISSMRGEFNSQIEAHIQMKNYVKSHNCRIMIISSANAFDSFRHFPSYEYDKTFLKVYMVILKLKLKI